MSKKNKKSGGGLPGWFATYSDMMTLLFAFFVLLFSLSTLDPVKLAAFSDGEKGGDAIPDPNVKEKLDLAEIKDEFEEMIKELNMDSTATVSQDPRGIALEIDGDICEFGVAQGKTSKLIAYFINGIKVVVWNKAFFMKNFLPIFFTNSLIFIYLLAGALSLNSL